MNFILAISAVLFTVSMANATTEVAIVPENQTTINVDEAEWSKISSPQLRFILGRSDFTENQKEGIGISFAGEKELTRFIGVGVGYSIYSLESPDLSNNSDSQFSKKEKSLDLYSAYLSFVPIQYSEKRLSFSGAAHLGTIYEDDSIKNKNPFVFFGAALELGYNSQIGLRIERKMSEEFEAINTLSMVGYY